MQDHNNFSWLDLAVGVMAVLAGLWATGKNIFSFVTRSEMHKQLKEMRDEFQDELESHANLIKTALDDHSDIRARQDEAMHKILEQLMDLGQRLARIEGRLTSAQAHDIWRD